MPKVESHASDGAIVTRADSRGSNAGTVVRSSVAAPGALARDEANRSKRTPGVSSTR